MAPRVQPPGKVHTPCCSKMSCPLKVPMMTLIHCQHQASFPTGFILAGSIGRLRDKSLEAFSITTREDDGVLHHAQPAARHADRKS